MPMPAERPDLHVAQLRDQWNERADDHNSFARQLQLLQRARRLADLRNQDQLRGYDHALDQLEAEHAWRVATNQADPYAGRIDAAGYPTMTEQEWTEVHGSHPAPSPPPPPTPTTGDDGEEEVVDEGRHAATEQVPSRKRNEPVEVWAARILAANPDRNIGWKRLSTLVGGLNESPARRVVDAHRKARTA